MSSAGSRSKCTINRSTVEASNSAVAYSKEAARLAFRSKTLRVRSLETPGSKAIRHLRVAEREGIEGRVLKAEHGLKDGRAAGVSVGVRRVARRGRPGGRSREGFFPDSVEQLADV